MSKQFVHGQIRKANGIDYIVTDQTGLIPLKIKVEVVEVNDLQRNITDPSKCTRLSFPKEDLEFVADDLESLVASWNVGK